MKRWRWGVVFSLNIRVYDKACEKCVTTELFSPSIYWFSSSSCQLVKHRDGDTAPPLLALPRDMLHKSENHYRILTSFSPRSSHRFDSQRANIGTNGVSAYVRTSDNIACGHAPEQQPMRSKHTHDYAKYVDDLFLPSDC